MSENSWKHWDCRERGRRLQLDTMGLIKRFFCCTVRSGALFSSIYALIASAVYISIYLVRYVGFRLVDHSLVHGVAAYSTFVLFGSFFMMSICLVVSVNKDIKAFFAPWIILNIMCLCQATVVLIWLIVTQLRNEGKVDIWEVVIAAFHVLNVTFSAYCIVCVTSQLQDLIMGKGTASYYRRQRRRRHRQGPAVVGSSDLPPDLETDPREGHDMGSPPPYSEHPPPYTVMPQIHEHSILHAYVNTRHTVNQSEAGLPNFEGRVSYQYSNRSENILETDIHAGNSESHERVRRGTHRITNPQSHNSQLYQDTYPNITSEHSAVSHRTLDDNHISSFDPRYTLQNTPSDVDYSQGAVRSRQDNIRDPLVEHMLRLSSRDEHRSRHRELQDRPAENAYEISAYTNHAFTTTNVDTETNGGGALPYVTSL